MRIRARIDSGGGGGKRVKICGGGGWNGGRISGFMCVGLSVGGTRNYTGTRIGALWDKTRSF